MSWLKKWFRPDPVVITQTVEVEVIDPQSALKAAFGSNPDESQKRYIELDRILGSEDYELSVSDITLLIAAWECDVEDLGAFARDLHAHSPRQSWPETNHGRDYASNERVRNVTTFLKDTGYTKKGSVPKEKNGRIYSFPPIEKDDPKAGNPISPFPYDRTAALSKGGIYVPPHLRSDEKELHLLSQQLIKLGIKNIKLPPEIRKKLDDQAKGNRRFIFDESRKIVFIDPEPEPEKPKTTRKKKPS